LDNINVTNKKNNTMLKNITIKIDEDNDIYEITINNVTYTLDDIYDSEYSELFDELNLLIDKY
jgi:hypothetical protein